MPTTLYEILPPGGHEALSTEIFTKIKAYMDAHGPGSKVDRAGDTMTGELNLYDTSAKATDTSFSTDVNPSSAVWGNGFYLYCSDARVGYLRAIKSTTGEQGVQIETERYISGTRYFHNLNLRIDNSGNKIVEVGAPNSWCTAINAVNKSGDTMTGNLTIKGYDVILGTTGTSSNDSGDLLWNYGNGQEKMRIWTNNEYTAASGPNFRVYKADGTSLYSGTLAIHNKSDHLAPISNGTRLASANQQGDYNGSLFTFMATSSMTTGKPPEDAHIIHSCWDNNGGWDVQLAIGHSNAIYTRCMNGETWTAWKKYAYSDHTHSYLPLSGGTLTGNLKIGNTTIYSGGSNGGINSVIFGDDVTLGDCNVGGMLGMKSTGTNCGIRLYNSSGGLIGGFQSTNGTAQWINSSGTAYNIYHTGNKPTYSDVGAAAASHTHSYLPLSGGTMTGSILLKATNLNKDSNITAWGKELDFYDTNNKRLGLFNVKQYGVRKVELHLGCIDGNENWNEIVLKNDVSVSYYAVTSPINFRSAIGAAASSSKLTKTNIQDMTDDEAKKILDINVKSFDYKEGFVQPTDIKEKYYGVIAEECLEKIPYAVNVPEGYDEKEFDESKGLEQKLLLMDYPNFVPYLIKMVQIQQNEIDILKTKLS